LEFGQRRGAVGDSHDFESDGPKRYGNCGPDMRLVVNHQNARHRLALTTYPQGYNSTG
jgi:hypothetical protein